MFPGFPVVPPPEEEERNAIPALSLSIDRIADTRVRLRLDAQSGTTYSLQASSGAAPITWEELASINPGSNENVEGEVEVDRTARLFRLLVMSP